ncbi:MAG: DUF721 domain-containing protein [Verrucomicrobia bacterium]|nr:DUF721 domain-containing protein [Verrucomicrobiota bacterium]
MQKYSPINLSYFDPKRRVLAEWRGMDLAAEELADSDNAKNSKELVDKVIGSLDIEKWRTREEIIKVWNCHIDPNITEHAQPVRLSRGTLYVSVDHSVWLSELVRYRYREILEQMRNCFGKDAISKISFRIG